eukprot:3128289-Pleurochrysis_carterae.AAC.6
MAQNRRADHLRHAKKKQNACRIRARSKWSRRRRESRCGLESQNDSHAILPCQTRCVLGWELIVDKFGRTLPTEERRNELSAVPTLLAVKSSPSCGEAWMRVGSAQQSTEQGHARSSRRHARGRAAPCRLCRCRRYRRSSGALCARRSCAGTRPCTAAA